MKKKWMVLLLAAAMTAGLAACGGGGTETQIPETRRQRKPLTGKRPWAEENL